MDGIQLSTGGKKLLFANTGEVAEIAADNSTTVVGKWDSSSPDADNKIRYDLGGTAQTPLQAAYDFNATNQLTATLTDGTTTSAAFTFQGRIAVSRDHNVAYTLVNKDGIDTKTVVTVYVNKFAFAEETNNLVLTLATGVDTEITGETGVQSLEAERNHIAKFNADDLLMFHAVTRNTFDGQEVPLPADLNFIGNWDIQSGTLVFISKIEGDLAHPGVQIGFAGTFKGVTAGFVYFADGNTTEIALNIRGQHTFKNPDSQTDLTWETSIGFSNKTFQARVDVDLKRTTAKGGVLDLHGNLQIEQPTGGRMTIDLSIKAQYRFNANNVLVFQAVMTDGNRPSYDLSLAGTFVYSNLKLTFKIQYTNVAGSGELHAEIGLQGSKTSIVRNLALVLDISEQQAKLKLSLTFEVKVQFANGNLVKKIPPAVVPRKTVTAGQKS